MFQFAQQSDVFQPTEALLDPLSLLLTDLVTGMPCGARIDGAAATPPVVLLHVRGYVHVAALVEELRRVESLVAADRDAPVAGKLLQPQKRPIALGAPAGLEQLRVHDQAIAVLYQQIAVVAQLGLLAFALARQKCVRIGL